MTTLSPAAKVVFPDLISRCPFLPRVNKNVAVVSTASEQWIIQEANFSEKRLQNFLGLKAGLLTAMCYPDCDAEELRVISDFMNYIFNLDDWSDEFDDRGNRGLADSVMNVLHHPETFPADTIAGKMARSFWKRLVQKAGPRCQQRFLETFDMFFQAVAKQSLDRSCGVIPDLESYISLRRDTGDCKSTFALLEYAAGIDLPDEVADHPIIRDLNNATNDYVAWSNDIFSYNVEHARGDTHNIVAVIMHTRGYDLQTAVDHVGELCQGSLVWFMSSQKLLPSWGPEIDAQVNTYVLGLQNWIAASLHWSFETERYFGKRGQEIKRTHEVTLDSGVLTDTPSG